LARRQARNGSPDRSVGRCGVFGVGLNDRGVLALGCAQVVDRLVVSDREKPRSR
jgi:hypothetical protein